MKEEKEVLATGTIHLEGKVRKVEVYAPKLSMKKTEDSPAHREGECGQNALQRPLD